MTSKEIVERTLNYQCPERVARSFGDSDFVLVKADVKTRATCWVMAGNGKWERFDEWGNLWRGLNSTSKGEVEKYVLEDVSQVDGYELPDNWQSCGL